MFEVLFVGGKQDGKRHKVGGETFCKMYGETYERCQLLEGLVVYAENGMTVACVLRKLVEGYKGKKK